MNDEEKAMEEMMKKAEEMEEETDQSESSLSDSNEDAKSEKNEENSDDDIGVKKGKMTQKISLKPSLYLKDFNSYFVNNVNLKMF